MTNQAFKVLSLLCIYLSSTPSSAEALPDTISCCPHTSCVVDTLAGSIQRVSNTPILSSEACVDSVQSLAVDTLRPPGKRRSFIQRFLDYFNDANKNKNNKRFDFSIIGGPHYSTDTELGLGLVAAGLYRTSPNDTLSPPSNVSLFSDVSTVGFYLLGIRGNHLMKAMRHRIDYKVYFYSFPSDYWGMGYHSGNIDENKSSMHRWQGRVQASFLTRMAKNFYVGPMFDFDYVKASKVSNPELLNGQDKELHSLGLGFSLVYDSRDTYTNAHRGVYLNIEQMFMPKFLDNKYDVASTTFNLSGYRMVWKGCVLAADLRGMFNFGNPSWAMMALLGSSNSMRGYYEGRYRDKHKIETTIELRQHVWKRNGIVLWVGAGTVFPKFSKLDIDHVLPNYGFGYRWEFKKNVNVRLDYGFGKKGQSGFLFNINEAF
ncbi:MAG: BamA/TamA family outer membrane protein [Prevotella sp.]